MVGNPGLVGICRWADDCRECHGNYLVLEVLARQECRFNSLRGDAEVPKRPGSLKELRGGGLLPLAVSPEQQVSGGDAMRTLGRASIVADKSNSADQGR